MADDRGKSKKEQRLDKAKGRLQPFPDIQRIRRSGAVEIAQSLFRQFADDIQLKDLLAKAEALVTKAGSKEPPPSAALRDVTSSSGSSKSVGAKKTPSKRAHPGKARPMKMSSKKKKKPAPKRKVKTRS